MFSLHPRRPLYVLAVTVFFITAFLVRTGEANGWYIALVAALGLAVLLCIPSLRRVGSAFLALFGIAFSALGTYLFYIQTVLPLSALDGQTVTVAARVQTVEEGETPRYVLTVTEDGTLRKGTRLSVAADSDKERLQRYGSVRGTVSLYTPTSKTSFGDGVFLAGVLESVESVTSPQPRYVERLTDTLRARFTEGIYSVVPEREAAFITGVCIGDVSDVSDDVIADFRKSGLAHLTVVSGLHMTIVSGAVLGFLKLLRVRRLPTTLITLAAVWLFVLTVGLSVSVIRAAVMLHCLLLGNMFRRRSDGRTALSVALFLIILENPYAVCDVGFLLSFAATWGLIVLMPLWSKLLCRIGFINKRRWLQNLLQPIGCSLAAMVFTAPISAYVFGSLTILSPLSNLLTSWPVTMMLPCAFLGGILYRLSFLRMLATPLLWVSGMLARWVKWVARWVASMSVSVLQIRHPVWLFLLLLLPFSISAAAKFYGRRGVWRVLVANTAMACVLVAAFSYVYRRDVSIRVADTGCSTVTVMENASFSAAVISGEGPYACEKARWYLTDCGMDALDVLVVTDYSKKAAEALDDLLKQVSVDTVLCPAEDNIADATLLENGKTFRFDEGLSFAVFNGWWRMVVGETSVLFAACDSLVEALPKTWQDADLAVVRQSVPDDMRRLTVQHIVAVCAEKHLTALKMRLAAVTCPVTINHETAFCTTGDGDLQVNNNFWL